MKRVMVQYKVKADKAAENRRYIEEVFKELHARMPEGMRYASFVQPDGLSFVHIVSLERADGGNPLGDTEAFKAFTKDIKARCEEGPTPVELQEVGSYRFFGG